MSDMKKIEQLIHLYHFNREMKIDRRLNVRRKNVYPSSLEETITINYRYIILLNKSIP